MATAAKYKGVFKADATGSATVTTDYSSGVIDFSIAFTKNTGQHFTVGSLYQQSTEGGMGLEVTANVRFDTTSTTAYQVFMAWAIAGGARTLQLYTPDSTTGSMSVSGEFICAGPDNVLDVSGGSGDIHSVSFKFQSDSTFTVATV